MLMNYCMHSYFIFVVSITILDVAVVGIGQRSSICNYYVTFDLFNAGHISMIIEITKI